MRVQSYDRVVYENNPLAEVVCQLRFADERPDFSSDEKSALVSTLGQIGYEFRHEVAAPRVSRSILVLAAQQRLASSSQASKLLLQQFASEDGLWDVYACPVYVSLFCRKYVGWDDFRERFLAVAAAFLQAQPQLRPRRLGLRYKDVIEREGIGLAGAQWHELISPFLLGPLALHALADQQAATDEDASHFVSQSQLQLDGMQVLLQSGLLRSVSGDRRAFLIDADFFMDEHLEIDWQLNPSALAERLQRLHDNAGALFRRGITEKLHHALKPMA